MEMTQCEEEDRTRTQKDGWAGSLSSTRSEREEKRGWWLIEKQIQCVVRVHGGGMEAMQLQMIEATLKEFKMA